MKRLTIIAAFSLVVIGSLIAVSELMTPENAGLLLYILLVIWLGCLYGIVRIAIFWEPDIPASGQVFEDQSGNKHGQWSGRISGYEYLVLSHSADDDGKTGYVTVYFNNAGAILTFIGWPQRINVSGRLPKKIVRMLGTPISPGGIFGFLTDLGIDSEELASAWPNDPRWK